jgi:hypothetical protein
MREPGHEDYMPPLRMLPYKPVKHCHVTAAGMTGWSQPAGNGKHWHPSVDGPTTPAADTEGHTHETPSHLVTGERKI